MLSEKLPVQLDVSTILELVNIPSLGHVLAVNVSEEDYMRDYAELHCEWVDGVVVKMSPAIDRHIILMQHFIILFRAYFEQRPIGEVRNDPFVMRYEMEIDGKKKRRDRQPDIQIIMKDNPHPLNPSHIDGAADICIEIVSQESIERDYGIKYHEYETVGVREYWIIDPLKKEARFYRLNEKKAFVLQKVEEDYSTPIIPNLKINIATFWKEIMPGPWELVEQVRKMLED